MRSSLEESMPVFLQTMWDVTLLDIHTTLKTVCSKILKDVSVPWQIRERRAWALLRLGHDFRAAGEGENPDQHQTAKECFEDAFMGSVVRANC